MIDRPVLNPKRQTLESGSPRVFLAAGLLLLVSCLPSHAAEFERIARALRLVPAMRVADIGAGEGKWSLKLGKRVGTEGYVYATEVEQDLVEEIAERFAKRRMTNAVSILGTAEDTGLPAGCCDAVLLRMVYHHFTRPAPMRASLRQAMKPGALLAVIDIRPQENWRDLPGVPERGGHGLSPEDLILEMGSDGFDLVERIDEWNGDKDRYCVVFRQAETPPGSSDGS